MGGGGSFVVKTIFPGRVRGFATLNTTVRALVVVGF
jgi:hypothetical protein